MRLTRCAALLVLALCAQAARADVFLEVQKNGTLLLSDRPLSSRARLIQVDHSPAARKLPRDAQIRRAAERHGVDPLLVHAVVRAESGYDPSAVSRKGAAGLMQLMPETARRYGVTNRFDPATNLDAGVRYLRDLLRLFGGNLSLALRLQRRRGAGAARRRADPRLSRDRRVRTPGAPLLQGARGGLPLATLAARAVASATIL